MKVEPVAARRAAGLGDVGEFPVPQVLPEPVADLAAALALDPGRGLGQSEGRYVQVQLAVPVVVGDDHARLRSHREGGGIDGRKVMALVVSQEQAAEDQVFPAVAVEIGERRTDQSRDLRQTNLGRDVGESSVGPTLIKDIRRTGR